MGINIQHLFNLEDPPSLTFSTLRVPLKLIPAHKGSTFATNPDNKRSNHPVRFTILKNNHARPIHRLQNGDDLVPKLNSIDTKLPLFGNPGTLPDRRGPTACFLRRGFHPTSVSHSCCNLG